jgi:catechol 2,3-dioxygenase-like lactoylglutathione lyase family enzyme
MGDNRLGITFNRVTARVEDIDRAVGWYRDMLGFAVGERGVTPNGVMKFAYLHLPTFGVSLVEVDAPAPVVEGEGHAVPSWVHPVLEVSDPDQLYRTLEAQGAAVFTRGPAGSDPITTFLVKDSEGNEIEITARA